MSKQLANKQRKPTTTGAIKSSKVSSQSARAAAASDSDESSDEGVAETQYHHDEEEPPARAKASKAKGGRAVDDDEEPLTAREKRLQARLDITNAAFAKVQISFDQLSTLRTTDAEAAHEELEKVAKKRYENYNQLINKYTSENAQLQAENKALREAAAAAKSTARTPALPTPATSASPTSPADPSRVAELEKAVTELEAENLALSAQVEASRAKAEEGAKKVAGEKDNQWKGELAKAVKAKEEESAQEIAQLRLELAAEVAMTKSLQAKSSTNASSINASAAPSSSQANALAKIRDEMDTMKKLRELAEDLTGLEVKSYRPDENGHMTYNCILSDCLGKVGALSFKMQFREDNSVRFDPDVDPARDHALADALPEQMQQYMRFRSEDTAKWFRSLFKSLNKLD